MRDKWRKRESEDLRERDGRLELDPNKRMRINSIAEMLV